MTDILHLWNTTDDEVHCQLLLPAVAEQVRNMEFHSIQQTLALIVQDSQAIIV